MRKDIRYMLILFLLAFIPKGIIALQMIPYPVYDEGGSMAFSAYLAGKDWSNVISLGSYYGFGYYSWFAPIFRITDNPYLIYKLICLINAIVQAICGIICYIIISKFLGKRENYIENSVISLYCSYLVVVRVQAYNENGLLIISWIICALLCLLIYSDSNKKKNMLSAFIWMLAVYSITIHTRAIILIIALLCVAIIYRLIFKERLFPIFSYIILMLGYISTKIVVSIVQKTLWTSDINRLHNASIDVSSHLGNFDLSDFNAYKAIICVVLGQINALNIFSGGIFVLSLVILLVYIFRNWRLSSKKYKSILAITVIFSICFVGMIVGQSITWGDGVYKAISQNLKNQDVYKAFTYVRYPGVYLGPIIMCGLVNETFKELKKRSLIFVTVIVAILIHIFWFQNILPLVSESLVTFESFIPLALRKPRQPINYEMYLCVTAWFIMLEGLAVILLINNKKKIYIFLLSVYLCFQFLYIGYYNDVYYGEEHSQMAIKSYDFLQNVLNEDEQLQLDKIYMYNGDYIREQFYFNNLEIVVGTPQENIDNAILLYKGNLKDAHELQDDINVDDYGIVELDSALYILVKGKTYTESIERSGYSITKLSEVVGEF